MFGLCTVEKQFNSSDWYSSFRAWCTFKPFTHPASTEGSAAAVVVAAAAVGVIVSLLFGNDCTGLIYYQYYLSFHFHFHLSLLDSVTGEKECWMSLSIGMILMRMDK